MATLVIRIMALCLIMFTPAAEGRAPRNSEGSPSYSHTGKVTVFSNDTGDKGLVGMKPAIQSFKYPDRQVFIFHEEEIAKLPGSGLDIYRNDEMNKIYLRGLTIDTSEPIPPVPEDLKAISRNDHQLYILQFAGPIQDE